MKNALFNKMPVLISLVLALLFANLQVNKRASMTDNCFNICGDARGYYAWLPAIFIYHDLNFHFFDSVEVKETTCGSQSGMPPQDYRYRIADTTINKYYPGTSFMMLPFFGLAHMATKYFSNYEANGYSPLYFRIMGLGAAFYYFVGMLFMIGILGLLNLGPVQKTLTVLFLTFGTNIMYYVIDSPVYSHVYSFALVAALIYFALLFRGRYTVGRLAMISFLAGWIFIARPVNIVVIVLLPFLFYNTRETLKGWFMARKSNILFVLPMLIMPALLFVLYKVATGHFFVYSYGKEGFSFLHPHFFQFLFSYDNGIFPYTPLLLVAALMCALFYRAERMLVTGIFVTAALAIYIHSSWWAWSYGLSFGARTMLDLVPLFGILLGLSLKQINLKRYLLLLPVYALCCGLTMILYHQKSHGGYMKDLPITDYWRAIDNGLGIK